MQGSSQLDKPKRNLPAHVTWIIAVAVVVVLALRGQYPAALGVALAVGIFVAAAKGIIPEQGPSKAGNTVAIVLVVAIVAVVAFVWWVVSA